MRTAATLVVLASVLLAGCGGGSSGPLYDLAATRGCLRSAGANVGPDTTRFVDKASRGNLLVERKPYPVHIAFGKSGSEAGSIATDVKGIANLTNEGDTQVTGVVVERKGNVAYYVTSDTFPAAARRQVERCLKKA